MNRATRLLAAWALAFAMAFGMGCGASEETPAPAPPAPAKPSPQRAPEPPPAPPPTASPEPVETAPGAAAGEGDPARGEPLYATYCASCHGLRGDGDGPVAAGLDPKPAAHSDAAYMDALSDEHLYRVISQGGPAVGKSPMMASWAGSLDEAQIWDVVAFIRTLSR